MEGRYLRWFRMIPASWYSHPYEISSPWMWTEPSDLSLTNKIWQKWWDDTSIIILLDCGFPLPSRHLQILMKRAAILGRLVLQGIQGGIHAKACKELRPLLQKPSWNWLLPTTLEVSLGGNPFPVALQPESTSGLQSKRDSDPDSSPKVCLDSWPTKTVR